MTDVISTQELANSAGCSRQWIGTCAREGLADYAKLGRGKWDKVKALEWIEDRRRDGADGGTPEQKEALTAVKIDYYKSKTAAQEIQNDRMRGVLIYRDTAMQAVNGYAAQQLSSVDSWARDVSDEAGRLLASKGLSSAEVIQVKAEVANGLRREQSGLARRVHDVLSTVEDVGTTRIRLSG